MDPEQFSHSTPGRVIQVGTREHTYHAFVPNDLPPDLAWDDELGLALTEAERSLGELNDLAKSNPRLPVGAFIRREAVFSSAIEDIEIDLADLYAYEAGQFALPGVGRPGASTADTWEVLNCVRALEYGLERVGKSPLSLRLIRELHKRLMGGTIGGRATPGEFRNGQNWIGRPGATLQEADFVPPPPKEVQAGLERLEKYVQGDDRHPALVRLVLIHYQFETIHPFIDGNGRVGRMLILLLLVRWGLLSLPLLCLSAFFERHRDEYYDLLMAVSERGAWKEWVEFFLRGVDEQARDAAARAKQLQDLQANWRDRLAAERSALPSHLADMLFETPIVSIPQVERWLNVTYPTAQRDVERLVEANILQQAGESSYGKTFVAREIFDIITAQ